MKTESEYYQIQVKAEGVWRPLYIFDRYDSYTINFNEITENCSFGLDHDDYYTPDCIREGVNSGEFRIVKIRETIEILEEIYSI